MYIWSRDMGETERRKYRNEILTGVGNKKKQWHNG